VSADAGEAPDGREISRLFPHRQTTEVWRLHQFAGKDAALVGPVVGIDEEDVEFPAARAGAARIRSEMTMRMRK
jgi:hypothetical protein